MEPENLDIASITDARRAAIEQTIKPIGSDELKAIGEKLFPFFDHPWRQTFFQFLEENSGSTIYRATTNDAIEILYCAEKDIGIWFLLKGGRNLGAPLSGSAGPMVRGVEVNGSIAMTHAVIVSATTTVRFVTCICAQAKPSSKFELANSRLAAFLKVDLSS